MANALSVGSEFLKRKMNWRSFCTLCDGSSPCVESISYLFRDCSYAKALWFGCPLGLRITGGVDIDVRVWVINWITYFLIGPDPNSLLFPLIATLWRIWCCRNERIFKNRRPWPMSALHSILGDIQFKCDAAWRVDRSAGMGWCLLDDNGTLRNTAHARSFASSALHVEGHAAFMALKWVLNEGYLHVRLVRDCLNLVLQAAGAEKPIASINCIIQDIKSIASHFHCCSLSFCPRGVNRIAHNLAQGAHMLGGNPAVTSAAGIYSNSVELWIAESWLHCKL
ncbi:uncharacterized protein LOC141608111 [Silene latifolia]|uniref:uncharacterized protein LOC141608111 n=1 Tax=Silene latifolia TaxID=37657 RepID=UPI003D77C1F2